MEEPQMYIKKRNGWMVFRRPIPKALQPFITQGCRTEFIVSLKTKDRKEVARLYADGGTNACSHRRRTRDPQAREAVQTPPEPSSAPLPPTPRRRRFRSPRFLID